MEIEIKLRLAGREDHDKVAACFGGEPKALHHQENFFFDGKGGELTSQRVVLRVRFYNTDERAVVTVKGKAVLADGVGKASEIEEAIDPALARAFVADPDAMLSSDVKILRDTCARFAIGGLRCLGGFRNVRKEFDWTDGLLIELDETQFEWGTVYEVECETTNPDRIKPLLEAALTQGGARFQYSKVTKFQNFVNRTLE